MIVKYCDKCEKIISEEEIEAREEDRFPNGYFEVIGNRPFVFDNGELAHLGCRYLDLCQDCAKKLSDHIAKFLGAKALKPVIVPRSRDIARPCNSEENG